MVAAPLSGGLRIAVIKFEGLLRKRSNVHAKLVPARQAQQLHLRPKLSPQYLAMTVSEPSGSMRRGARLVSRAVPHETRDTVRACRLILSGLVHMHVAASRTGVSVISTNPTNNRMLRSLRISSITGVSSTAGMAVVRRCVATFVVAVALIPVTAVASMGAGTTAVAPATSDPLAVAAANALDLLKGGIGGLQAPAPKPTLPTPVTSVPAAPVPSSPTQPVQPSVPPVAQPGQPAPPSTWPSTVVPYNPPTAPLASSASSASFSGLGNAVEFSQQFAGPAPISMLPAPTTVSPPVILPVVETTVPTQVVPTSAAKKAKKQAAPVVVGAAPAAPVAGGSYDGARRAVADLVAARLSTVSGDALDQAWANADPRRMVAVYAALAQVGTAYRYSGNEPGGFDCSGLTSYAWGVAGVKLPRTSTDQINAANPRSPNQLLPGDLVWRPGHIMMYLGAGENVIDSPQTGKTVRVRQWGRTSRYGSPI
jgi:cell wall-associated NlpC family hydrolase